MILGIVTELLEPIIPLTLISGKKKILTKAVIDTGFNGYLSVPLKFTKGWKFFGYERYEIATGDLVDQKIYIGQIIWEGKVKYVYAVSSCAEDILIGTKLLKKNKLQINFKTSQVKIL